MGGHRHILREKGLEMVAAGTPIAEVARILDVSYSRVWSWRNQAALEKLPRQSRSAAVENRRGQALEMAKRGIPVPVIARRLGEHDFTVRRWCEGARVAPARVRRRTRPAKSAVMETLFILERHLPRWPAEYAMVCVELSGGMFAGMAAE